MRSARATPLGVGLGLLLIACAPVSRPGPDIVLVVVDTLRADRLGCYGAERATSPFLDEIARRSVLFESAHSPAPWTAPSLVSLMTSLHPDVHGVRGFPVPGRLGEGIATLAELLSRRGYHTAAFTEGGYARGDFGLDRGFDLYPESEGDAEDYASNTRHPSRLVANVDRAIEWLGARGDEPFFLFFHTYEVHLPLRAPDEHVRFFRPAFDLDAERAVFRAAAESWNARREIDVAGLRALQRHPFLYGHYFEFEDVPHVAARERLAARAAAAGVPLDIDAASQSPEMRSWLRDLYDAEIRFTDRELARLWRAFEARGRSGDAVLVFTSDHGEQLGERSRVGHGLDLHEELLRVPLLLQLPPPGAAPRRIAAPVRTLDVMPTLLELAGVDTGGLRLQGESLLPLLRGEPRPRPAFGSATQGEGGRDPREAVRTQRWRLVVDPRARTAALYDRALDPGETRDVSAEHPEVVAELRGLIGGQRRRNALLRQELGASGTEVVRPDPALVRELEALGYAESDGGP